MSIFGTIEIYFMSIFILCVECQSIFISPENLNKKNWRNLSITAIIRRESLLFGRENQCFKLVYLMKK